MDLKLLIKGRKKTASKEQETAPLPATVLRIVGQLGYTILLN